jgi:hypothetical protein
VIQQNLVKLQGIVTPRFYGLLGSIQANEHEMWAAVVEDGGQAISKIWAADTRILYVLSQSLFVLADNKEMRYLDSIISSIKLESFTTTLSCDISSGRKILVLYD